MSAGPGISIDEDFDFDLFCEDYLDLAAGLDDDLGQDDDAPNAGFERRGGKKSTAVRDHSKAQREKRKRILATLEKQAEELARYKEEDELRCHRTFDRLEVIRKTYIRKVTRFLQIWFGGNSPDLEFPQVPSISLNGSHSLDEDTLWQSIVDPDRLIITMPNIMSYWVPPTNKASSSASEENYSWPSARMKLRTQTQMRGYKAGFNLLCASIAKYGSNLADCLIISASLKSDTCVIDCEKRTLCTKFVVFSRNATICGGTAEISFGGFMNCRFSEMTGRVEMADIYFNAVEFHKQLLRVFGPSTYRPMILSDYLIVGEPSSFLDVGQVVTTLSTEDGVMMESAMDSNTWDSFSVLSCNEVAAGTFGGDVSGKQLLSLTPFARFPYLANIPNGLSITGFWQHLINWIPKYCCLSNAPAFPAFDGSGSSELLNDTFVQILPYRYGAQQAPTAAPTSATASAPASSATTIAPAPGSAPAPMSAWSNGPTLFDRRTGAFPSGGAEGYAQTNANSSGRSLSQAQESTLGLESCEIVDDEVLMSAPPSKSNVAVCFLRQSRNALTTLLRNASAHGSGATSDPTGGPAIKREPGAGMNPFAGFSTGSEGWIREVESGSALVSSVNSSNGGGAAVDGTSTQLNLQAVTGASMSGKKVLRSVRSRSERGGGDLSSRFGDMASTCSSRVTPSLIARYGPLAASLLGPGVQDDADEELIEYDRKPDSIPRPRYEPPLPPNRILWIMHKTRPVSVNSIACVLVHDFLKRILLVYGGKMPSWEELNRRKDGKFHDGEAQSSGREPMDTRWKFSSTGEIIGILARAKRLLATLPADSRGGVAVGCSNTEVLGCLKKFMRWVMAVGVASESLLEELEVEEEENGGNLGNMGGQGNGYPNMPPAETLANISSHSNKSNDSASAAQAKKRRMLHGAELVVPTPTGLTPVAEKQLIKAIAQELNVFFTQIRISGLISKLACMLKFRNKGDSGSSHGDVSDLSDNGGERDNNRPAEQFIFLCWTKHSNVLVQELMESAKECLSEKKYSEALMALAEVIKVDPHFAEAYNRRATVHFGLKNAEECFADIERVLSIEPFHYGALCGKGLMLMKLGRSAAAVEVFERAISINPVLGLGALGKQLKQCQEAAGLRSTKG